MGCLTCESVADSIKSHLGSAKGYASDSTWDIDSFRGSNDCPTCQYVAQYFLSGSPTCHLRGGSVHIAGKPKSLLTLYPICTRYLDEDENSDSGGGSVRPCPDHHAPLTLVPSNLLAPQALHFVPVDPCRIELDHLRSWLSYCDKNHSGICHTLSSFERMPWAKYMILIDTDRHCLIETKEMEPYVALSYVWGTIPNTLETTKSNYSDLSRQGALSEPSNLARLPQTIRDAVSLTKALHCRYLWVDRLCIIQDDPDLTWMSSIYANSYFTIIAADGDDADYGLRGIDHHSTPRSYTPRILKFSDDSTLMHMPELETQFNLTTWHHRGWTFQERVLSPRTAIFFRNRLLWECRQSTWYEDIAAEPNGVESDAGVTRRTNTRYSFKLQKWPDLLQYSILVSSYNSRLLRYQSDGLRAFSAILNVLSKSFEGGFLHGMPELFFDYALLWRANTPVVRRTHSQQNRQTSLFPSWSWAGWHGSVVISCLKISYLHLVDGDTGTTPLIAIAPLVSWYKTNNDTGAQVLVGNKYWLGESFRRDKHLPLPLGWMRREDNTGKHISNEYSSESLFKHKDIPDEVFAFPVPIINQASTSPQLDWANQLRFRSRRNFLFTGEVFGNSLGNKAWSNITMKLEPYCLSCTLVDSSSRWAGMLFLNISTESEFVSGEKCEVIIISRGTARPGERSRAKIWLEEWKFVDELKNLEVYEYYNVLCVERNGSSTYRKTIGRVWKEAWHRGNCEEIDVVLS